MENKCYSAKFMYAFYMHHPPVSGVMAVASRYWVILVQNKDTTNVLAKLANMPVCCNGREKYDAVMCPTTVSYVRQFNTSRAMRYHRHLSRLY